MDNWLLILHKMGGKQAHHAMHLLYAHGSPALAGARLRGKGTKISATLYVHLLSLSSKI